MCGMDRAGRQEQDLGVTKEDREGTVRGVKKKHRQ